MATTPVKHPTYTAQDSKVGAQGNNTRIDNLHMGSPQAQYHQKVQGNIFQLHFHGNASQENIVQITQSLATLQIAPPKPGAKTPPKPPEETLPSLIQEKLDHPHKEITLDQSIALLLACIAEGKIQAKKAEGKEVILFIGNTGSGKSTTVNYLCGCTLELIPPEDLGLEDAIDDLVIVKPRSQGGSKDEVMPIGHTKQSKTFMPQIEEDADTQNTYMDCPGFLDNRGVEINIANAVNIKNAIQESKTAKVVILINYHSLKAERGRGLSETLKIAYNLFGNEQNLLSAKDSILIGVTNAPSNLTITRLKNFITKDNPTLENFLDRIFTYDPLDRTIQGAWNREQFLSALKNLKPVPNHKRIFSTVLTYEDENKLLQISEALGERIQKALQKKEYEQASKHYLHLKTLSVIEHHTIERLFQIQRREIESHVHGQVGLFNSTCHLENFNEAEKLLELLNFALKNFQELDRIIDPPRLQDYYTACKNKQAEREANFKRYQDEIRAANKRIEDFIKLIDQQKSKMEKQLSDQEENFRKVLSTYESNYNEKLQNLETTMKELLTEKEKRLQKTEEELKIAQDLKDQETNKKLLDERKKLEEEYGQKLKKAEEEKNKILQDKEILLQKQQEAHKQKQQEIATQIQTLETQKVQQQKLQKGAIPEMAFGKAKWEKYFGDIGVEPPLPPNIDEILDKPCPFSMWSEKKVRETHLLVLIPQTVNGKSFCLNSLSELVKRPKSGHATELCIFHDLEELGSKSFSSHWVLMTRDVIPESANWKNNQCNLGIAEIAKRGFVLPKTLEAATAILTHYVETGERLYSGNFNYTQCEEKVCGSQWPALIGQFSSNRLEGYCFSRLDGPKRAAVVWKF